MIYLHRGPNITSIIIIKVLCQLCWGKQLKFYFFIPIWHRMFVCAKQIFFFFLLNAVLVCPIPVLCFPKVFLDNSSSSCIFHAYQWCNGGVSKDAHGSYICKLRMHCKSHFHICWSIDCLNLSDIVVGLKSLPAKGKAMFYLVMRKYLIPTCNLVSHDDIRAIFQVAGISFHPTIYLDKSELLSCGYKHLMTVTTKNKNIHNGVEGDIQVLMLGQWKAINTTTLQNFCLQGSLLSLINHCLLCYTSYSFLHPLQNWQIQ